MRCLRNQSIDFRSWCVGAAVAAATALCSSFAAPLGGPLTPEQEAVLATMSLINLDDGNGNPLATIRFTGVNVQVVNGTNSTLNIGGIGNVTKRATAVPTTSSPETTTATRASPAS